MKNRLMISIVSAALIALSTSSFAHTGKDNNEKKCPAVSAIASEGLTLAEQLGGLWIVGQTSKYNMDDKWTFAIGFFDAKDKEAALKKGTDALSTLSFKSGPNEVGGRTSCEYTVDLGPKVHAIAFTPPATNGEKLHLK